MNAALAENVRKIRDGRSLDRLRRDMKVAGYDIGQGTLARLAKGETGVAVESVKKLAEYARVEPAKLLEKPDTPAGPPRAVDLDERIDPYTAIQDAHVVMEAAANDSGTDVKWALLSLLEKASERVAAAVQREIADYSEALHEAASNELAGVLGLLGALDLVEEPLMGPVETLVSVCKNEIDRTIHEALNAEVPK